MDTKYKNILLLLLIVIVILLIINKIEHPVVKDINNFNPLKSYNVYTYIEQPTNYNKELKIQLLSKNDDIPIFFKYSLQLMKNKYSNLIILTPDNYLKYVSDFPIKMCPSSEYTLKTRVDLLSAFILEKYGGLFLSPGTIVYDKKDILNKTNTYDIVTFGKSRFNPNSYILGSKHDSEFIKIYKRYMLDNLSKNDSNYILSDLLSNYKFNQYHYSGDYDGSINSLNNQIFITDYLGTNDINYKNKDNLSLISVPYEELLRNQEYKWFNNLSQEQFIHSDLYIARLLRKLLKI